METDDSANPVPALLAAAGLSPDPEEVARISAGYPALRAAIDALYRVPEARYADPALRFHAADTIRADWAS
jgi:hypothetical protein